MLDNLIFSFHRAFPGVCMFVCMDVWMFDQTFVLAKLFVINKFYNLNFEFRLFMSHFMSGVGVGKIKVNVIFSIRTYLLYPVYRVLSIFKK